MEEQWDNKEGYGCYCTCQAEQVIDLVLQCTENNRKLKIYPFSVIILTGVNKNGIKNIAETNFPKKRRKK